MKKEDVISLLVLVISAALILVFGFGVLNNRPADTSTLTGAAYTFYLIGALLVGIVFNSILFELAHIIGAKIGRYEIIGVNVLYFCFTKVEGKWKFKFKSFEGLTGETKILPKKDAKKTPNPTAYLTFGTLFYLIEGIICLTLFVLFTTKMGTAIDPVKADVAYFLIVVAFIGLLIFLYNIIPFKLDSITDGYRLTLVSNPKNKVAFNELLRVEHEIALGNKDVEIMTFDEITNFTADLNLNKVYVLLNNGNYDEALPLIEKIIENKKNISSSVYIDAVSQLLFIKVMTLPEEEAIEFINSYVDTDMKRDISNANSMVASRAYILIEGLIDKSKHECINTVANIQKAFKKTSKARRAIEIKLFNLAIDKVIEKRPNWKFEQYRLVETSDNKSVEITGEEEKPADIKQEPIAEEKPAEAPTSEEALKEEPKEKEPTKDK